MSATLQIDHLRVELGVPNGSPEHRRLDGVLHRMLDSALEREVERAGVGTGGEEVCVQALRVPARLGLDANADVVLAEQWARAIATRLAAAVATGGPGIVRYASRRQALVDFASGVAQDRLERAWAWRQLGLWRGAEAEPGAALAAALLAEPRAIVPVLVALARAGLLPALGARLERAAWAELAAAALVSAGAAPAVARVLAGANEQTVAAAPGATTKPIAAVRRALARSAIVACALDVPPAALAALALAEAEPRMIAAHAGELPALIAALTSSVSRMPSSGAPRIAEDTGAQPADDPSFPESDAPLPERAEARTRWGGLTFILHAFEPLALPERFAEFDLTAALHALALRLVPAERDDPAALLLAGLAPTEEPPDPRWLPEPPEIAAAAADVDRWLAERLEIEPAALDRLAVLRREARIVADPGWLEVHLLIDEVDVDVRRAGLDLDPDWLPALGCVVRLVYD